MYGVIDFKLLGISSLVSIENALDHNQWNCDRTFILIDTEDGIFEV